MLFSVGLSFLGIIIILENSEVNDQSRNPNSELDEKSLTNTHIVALQYIHAEAR